MDPSYSANTFVNGHDNQDFCEVQFLSQSPQSKQVNEIDQSICVADKNELQKILYTVSLLSPSNVREDNPSEKVEHKKNNKRKFSLSSDGDEIQIVDVVIKEPYEKCSNSYSAMSANTSKYKFSNSPKNLRGTNFSNVNESNFSNVNELDVQIMSEVVSIKDSCQVPVIVHIDSASDDCVPLTTLETDDASVGNSLKDFNMDNMSPENCTVKNTAEVIDIKENEILSDSAMCNESVDLMSENYECPTYDMEYDFNRIPTQITGSWKEFNDGKKNNFTRGCKWAPDGSCILSCSDDNKLRIFNLPSQLWDSSQWCDISELEAVLRISEGDLIYDYCWYPLMNSNDASTCCLASTSRKSTVHLWDGYTGELRCSYRSFNHLDELVTPHSLSFDSDGEKLFCGFQHVIRVFDINRPGRLFEERRTYAYKTGQCGIISCFAFTNTDKNISAAGSYKSTIGLYAEPSGELSCLLEGQANGITQLQFSPDGTYLYSGGRKDPEILCWDLRNLGSVLFSMRRSVETNQRVYFDISKCGKYVVSGNQNGVITFWDVTKEPKVLNESDFSVLVPIQFFLAHDDCVNSTSFHPSYPLLCSSSGQRKFPILTDDDSEAIFSSEMEKQDNSLRLWWIGKLNK